MTYIQESLTQKEAELTHLLEEARKSLNKLGHLQVTSTRGHYHYLMNPPHDPGVSVSRRYMKKADLETARLLAQSDYSFLLIRHLEKQICRIQRLRKSYDPNELSDIYEHLHPARKTLVTPLVISNAEYAEQWKSVTYEGCPIDFGETEFYADCGLRVRSKSEIIIADRLDRCSVPFRYEYPLVIDPGITLYPDFTVLNRRTRQVYYWEHLGSMDDPEYVGHTLYKLNCYSSVGIITGKNLILTMETLNRPLNAKAVLRTIEDCLM